MFLHSSSWVPRKRAKLEQAKKLNTILFFLTVGSTIFTPVTFMSSATPPHMQTREMSGESEGQRNLWLEEAQLVEDGLSFEVY